jgi:glutaredoxin
VKILFALLIAVGAYNWYYSDTDTTVEMSGDTGVSHQKLIMYSLTTCGYCKQKVKELNSAGIPFTEYFIDKDPKRQKELHEKLAMAGFPPQSYGTPLFDAYGHMLPNNPSLAKIISLQVGE